MIAPFNDLNPKIHESAFITEDAIVIGDVEIGEDSSVWFGSVIRGDVNFIRIGARTGRGLMPYIIHSYINNYHIRVFRQYIIFHTQVEVIHFVPADAGADKLILAF